jgi:peptide/nickel transport system ATP-binding protein
VVTDEILVLHQGELVEHGPTRQVLLHPKHDYTQQLLAAVPNPFTVSEGAPS